MLFERRGCDTFLLALRYQLLRNCREAVARADAGCDPSLPLGSIGIDGMGELLLRIISSCSRLRERNRRISAEGQFTLHSMEAIFNAPKFAADRIDQKIKAARIRDLIKIGRASCRERVCQYV